MKNSPTSKLFLALAGTAAMSAFAYAAPIVSPNSVAVTADSQVLNLAPIFAYSVQDNIQNLVNGGGNVTTTVNGVAFQGNTSENGISLSFTTPNAFDGNGVNGQPAMSNAFATTLGGDFFTPATTTLNFSGLTAGTTYTLQLFAGFNWQNGSESVTDGSSTGLLTYGSPRNPAISGQAYIFDVFTPTGTTETLTLTGISSGYDFGYGVPLGQFSAVNLEVGAVPEPSAWALMGAGILWLGWRLRRNKLTA